MSVTFDEALLSSGGLKATYAPPLVHITLSRPSALNALLPATFHALHNILDCLSPHATPLYLLVTAEGRAFSAGGDVRSIREAVLPHPPRSPGRREAARGILATEYDFLSRWVSLDKRQLLTVGVAEGLAFGAGAGLLQACAVRLVGKKFTMAMPEVRIGLIPDCGATRFYAKLPGCVGMFLAMTGARVAARDAVALGLADGAVADGWRGEGLEGVAFDVDGIVQCTEAVQMLGEPSEMADAESELRRGVDEIFSAATVEEVVDRLQTRDGEWAKEALCAIRGGAPKAVRETFAVMRVAYKARGESLREAVDRELEVECRLTAEPDFEEGVRAALVDKDGKPKWEPL